MKTRLKELRVEHGLTQTDIAKELNTTKYNISMIENEKRGISLETLCTLCKMFEVSTDYFLYLTDKKNNLDTPKITYTSSRFELMLLTETMHDSEIDDLINYAKYNIAKRNRKG